MSVKLGSHRLHSTVIGSTVEIEFFRDIDEEQSVRIHERWHPILMERYKLAVLRYHQLHKPTQADWLAVQQEYGVPDAKWQWPDLFAEMRGRTTHASFCIEAQGEVQAAMRVDLTARCRLSSQAEQHLVYVERIAVAPWNRRQIQDPPLLTGLGKILLGVAVSLSIDEGWDGRTGLHSLIQADGFYRRVGMSDLGIDPNHEGLRYFEFSSPDARKFLE